MKGTKIKGASSPDQEPDFYAMVSLEDASSLDLGDVAIVERFEVLDRSGSQ